MNRYGIALAVAMCASTSAEAAFQITLNSNGPGHTGSLYYSYNGGQQTGTLQNVHYGQLNMTAIGQGAGGSNLSFATFCLDLTPIMTRTNLVTPMGSGANGSAGGGIAYLYNQYLGITNPTNDIAAQYQLAIWRLTLGEGATLTTGNTTLDAGANLLYQNALLHPEAQGAWLQFVLSYRGQGVLFPEGSPNPAPGVAVLLASGALTFGVAGIWRRRKAARQPA